VNRLNNLWTSLITLTALAAGCSASGPPEAPAGAVCEVPSVAHEGLVLAGSGSNLPLARRLAAVFTRETGVAVGVPGSIGTSGAVAAVRDGAVDVGLASRDLLPREAHEVHATALARTPLAFYAAVPEGREISREALIDLYLGRTTTWSGGQPVVLLVREEGDSGNAVIAASFPRLYRAMESARRDGRAMVQRTDHDMWVALRDVPGALGYLDTGIVALDGLPLRALRVDGVAAEHPSWPLRKTLYLLTSRGQPHPFVEFASTAEVQRRLPSWGYEAP
jgi:phosphate transport system substrate-binding protein